MLISSVICIPRCGTYLPLILHTLINVRHVVKFNSIFAYSPTSQLTEIFYPFSNCVVIKIRSCVYNVARSLLFNIIIHVEDSFVKDLSDHLIVASVLFKKTIRL